MTAPASLLDLIKEDLGITGTTDDAWLQRRLDGVWSRMEHYTSRALAIPPAAFVDDWTRMASTNQYTPAPPFYAPARGSVFLRYFPVTEIVECRLDGTPVDLASVTFDPKTGKLFSLQGGTWALDVSAVLRGQGAKITYKAGWATVPADLYEVVLGAMQMLWGAKQAAASGGIPGGGVVTGLNLVDVGSLEVTPGGNAFVQNAGKVSGGSVDPLLGPFLSYLDLYIDHRSLIGTGLLPVTEFAPVPTP